MPQLLDLHVQHLAKKLPHEESQNLHQTSASYAHWKLLLSTLHLHAQHHKQIPTDRGWDYRYIEPPGSFTSIFSIFTLRPLDSIFFVSLLQNELLSWKTLGANNSCLFVRLQLSRSQKLWINLRYCIFRADFVLHAQPRLWIPREWARDRRHPVQFVEHVIQHIHQA